MVTSMCGSVWLHLCASVYDCVWLYLSGAVYDYIYIQLCMATCICGNEQLCAAMYGSSMYGCVIGYIYVGNVQLCMVT